MACDLPPPMDTSAIIELRQYTLHPDKRDQLITLFERYFLDGQEASGMRVLGQFRDADDANRFVWLRGFRDMPARAAALQSFYGGPVWQAHRAAANATMVDSDNVLLLRPVDAGAGFTPGRAALYVATIYLLSTPVGDDFVRFFEREVRPLMTETGAPPIARLRTEESANNFPALPVRAGEHAFVWFAAFASRADYDRHRVALSASKAWHERVRAALQARLVSPEQTLRLEPTAHSRLGRGPWGGTVHDFDFLAGKWKIANRRLRRRGVGSHDWDELPATSVMTRYLGGIANADEIEFPTQGWSGMTVRAFDLEKRQWSIYWISSRTGTLFPPVVGGFEGERGQFCGDDYDDGRPVKVIFRWVKKGADAAHWEQAFSYDGGKTWETNWTMELTRVRD